MIWRSSSTPSAARPRKSDRRIRSTNTGTERCLGPLREPAPHVHHRRRPSIPRQEHPPPSGQQGLARPPVAAVLARPRNPVGNATRRASRGQPSGAEESRRLRRHAVLLADRTRSLRFCLFPSETYRGRAQLQTYRGYLEREIEMLRPWFAGDEVTSVYFGGGTANLYPAADYPELPRLVERLTGVPLSATAELTLEGIPQLFTRDKVAAIKDGGFTRVSMGVQQIDDDMIALSGRKQTAKHVWQTVEWCAELGLSLSVDLIFGWPNQTEARMVADLERVIAAGVRHITHYELNVAGRSDFARNHRDALPSIEDNQHLYQVAKQLLSQAGYRQATVYDWEKADDDRARYRFEEDLHRTFYADGETLRGNEMLGLGYAGVCNLPGTPDDPGLTYFNHTNLDAYFEALDAGRWPVERGFSFAAEDLRLVWLFQTMQTLRIDTDQYRRVFGSELRTDFGVEVQAIEEREWALQEGTQLRIIGPGELMVPTIQALFAARRTDALRRGASAPPPGMKAARRAGRREGPVRLPVC
ncbi:MAG: radical SAM protein [Myxococcota bacterium]